MTESNEFLENYHNMIEQYLEPRDPQKYGRFHTLLEETIYPIDQARVEYLAWTVHERSKFEKYRDSEAGDYHWWIYFDRFNPMDPNNMRTYAK